MIEICLPIRINSPNQKEHWTVSYKRNKRIAQAIGFTLRTNSDLARIAHKMGVSSLDWFPNKNAAQGFKIRIQFIRSGVKAMDLDNLMFAFKHIRDVCCSYFFPKLKPGQADGLDIFEIHYLQEKGKPGIKIILDFFDKR